MRNSGEDRQKENGREQTDCVLYIHGKGGNAGESRHYAPLFPGCRVVGLDYRGAAPWEAGPEIRDAVEAMKRRHGSIYLIANSIGAFFSMHAGIDGLIRKAYFISPVLDMEKLIEDMMAWARVTEAELEARGVIPTAFGEDLSWKYLSYVRQHPVHWTAPTCILYGRQDQLTSYDTAASFAQAHGAELTVMETGEHWFHTEEQMRYLDAWIRRNQP